MRYIFSILLLCLALTAWCQKRPVTAKKLRSQLIKTVAEKEDEPLMQHMRRQYLWPLAEEPLEAAIDLLPIIDRLTEATPLPVEDVIILPLPMANAAAIRGDGLMITTGLLAAARSQEDLAFVLAHELAHHQLGHTTESSPKPTSSDPVFAKNGVDFGALEQAKDRAYGEKSLRRQKEEDADAAGASIMEAAGYHPHHISHGLDVLSPRTSPKISITELYETFSFEGYPFSPYWLKERLEVYEQEPRLLFDLDVDSLMTHPDLVWRQERLRKIAVDCEEKDSSVTYTPLVKPYQMTNMVGAYAMGMYDESFRLALEYHLSDPGHGEVTAFITALLLEVYRAKNYGIADVYIPRSIYGYDEDQKLVNTFLLNLRKSQIHQLAYNFLTSEGRFQPNREDHLYLKWKLSALLRRPQEAKQAKREYARLFPKGVYKNKMSSPY